MDAARARKLADRISQIVAEMLERRIKDPRLGFVTVTEARLTNDLREATVFYTVYGSDQERADTAAALASATGIIRSEVGQAARPAAHPVARVRRRRAPGQRQADRGPGQPRPGTPTPNSPAAARARCTPATPTPTASPPKTRTRTTTTANERPQRPGHRGQARRHDVARRRGADPAAGRDQAGRARGDPGPDGHRRPGGRGGEGHPAARLPDPDREGVRRHDQARPVDQAPTTPRARSPRPRRPRRFRGRRSAAAVAALTGEIQQVPPGGQRDQGRRPARLQADQGGRGAGAGAQAGDGLRVRRHGPASPEGGWRCGRAAGPRRDRPLLERHLHQGPGPRPGRRAGHRRPPDPAASHPGGRVRPRAGPHPGSAGRTVRGAAAGPGRLGGLPSAGT